MWNMKLKLLDSLFTFNLKIYIAYDCVNRERLLEWM